MQYEYEQVLTGKTPLLGIRNKCCRSFSVLMSCVIYTIVGPALIFTNNKILKDLDFHYPILVSGIGQIFTMFMVIPWVLKTQSLPQQSYLFYFKNVAPIGAASAITLCAGNATYLYLSVSLVQILKACTPIILICMLYVTNVERPSKRIVACIFVVSGGMVLASIGKINRFNMVGIVLNVGACTFEATRLLLSQKLLSNVSAIEGIYYTSPMCTLWLLFFASIYEIPSAIEENAHAIIKKNLLTFCMSMILALAVNTSSFFVIKQTSSIMLKILGNARNASLVLFSVLFLEDTVNMTQGIGYTICLIFFGLYNYFKWLETG